MRFKNSDECTKSGRCPSSRSATRPTRWSNHRVHPKETGTPKQKQDANRTIDIHRPRAMCYVTYDIYEKRVDSYARSCSVGLVTVCYIYLSFVISIYLSIYLSCVLYMHGRTSQHSLENRTALGHVWMFFKDYQILLATSCLENIGKGDVRFG